MQIWKAKVVLGKIGNVCFLLRFCVFVDVVFLYKVCFGVKKNPDANLESKRCFGKNWECVFFVEVLCFLMLFFCIKSVLG